MSQNNTVPDIANVTAQSLAKEIRGLLKLLPPNATARRKKLQADLRQLTKTKPLNLTKYFKGRREATLQWYKDKTSRSKLANHQKAMWRARVRPPLASCGTIVDTRKDSSGKRLYVELANGQAIEATRILGLRRVNVDAALLPLKLHNATYRRILKPLGNPALVRIAAKAVSDNAARRA